MTILIPSLDIPNHYTISPNTDIITTDYFREEFRWSRIVRNNYIEGRGFITLHGDERITLGSRCGLGPNHTLVDYTGVLGELLSLLLPNKATIFHYLPSKELHTVIINVENHTFERLPEQFKRYYYS